MAGQNAVLLRVDVQRALDESPSQVAEEELEEPPSSRQLSGWAECAYRATRQSPAEVSIRLVDEAEMVELNGSYRDKQGATNVLSFAVDDDFQDQLEVPLLGDIVICHPVIIAEARAQSKTLPAHYAHMVVHGVLHLCGFDHEADADARRMETLETQILEELGFANPY